MYLLVIGYYDKGNLGDEAYKDIMGKYFPGDILDFILSDKISNINPHLYDAIIVGGGDIINDYFNQKIGPTLSRFKGPRIAFSIGIPFPSLITPAYLGHFDHVFTRNYEDLRPLQRVVGSHHAHFIPDIALGFQPSRPRSEGKEGACGIFIVGNLIRYPTIVAHIAHLMGKIALTYKIILYCFNPKEDYPLAELLQTQVQDRLRSSTPSDQRGRDLVASALAPDRIQIEASIISAQPMIDQIQDLSFGVCMRYHAHIFCAVANTPFISISSTRKTRSFMAQAGLESYQYKIPLDGYGNPTPTDYKDLRAVCRLGLKNRRMIRAQLKLFMCQSQFLLANLQVTRLIRHHTLDIRTEVSTFIDQTHDYQNGARLLSKYVLGYPDTPYVWGMCQKLSQGPPSGIVDVVHQSVKYLLRQGATRPSPKFGSEPSLRKGPLYVDLREYQSYQGAHRGGWYLGCEALARHNTIDPTGMPTGIICDLYLDRTFHWARNYFRHAGIIPYTGPWCGVIHHTQDLTYSNYNTALLFECPEFIQSLHTCRALICLSSHLATYITNRLEEVAPHIRVLVLDHPVINPPTFWELRADRFLIQVGAWMRNPLTIYRLEGTLPKAVLIGKEMEGLVPPSNFSIRAGSRKSKGSSRHKIVTLPCRDPDDVPSWIKMAIAWLNTHGAQVQSYRDGIIYIEDGTQVESWNRIFQEWIGSVQVISYQSDQSYDQLLSHNVVFLDLVDAAAVNTVIECIVRRTPILINDLPGTRALLGQAYPLYYTDLSQIGAFLQPERLEAASAYLGTIDCSKYELSTFVDRMMSMGLELDSW